MSWLGLDGLWMRWNGWKGRWGGRCEAFQFEMLRDRRVCEDDRQEDILC